MEYDRKLNETEKAINEKLAKLEEVERAAEQQVRKQKEAEEKQNAA